MTKELSIDDRLFILLLWRYLIISALIVIGSFLIDLVLDDYEWFYRSGALMAIVAIVVEFKLAISHKDNTGVAHSNNLLAVVASNSEQHAMVQDKALCFLFTGIFITIYGDLFFLLL